MRRQIARVDRARTRSGIAFARAIDSDVRAVGRIVVWVEAAAEVSTAMITILSTAAQHVVAEQPERVARSRRSAIASGPANATAAAATST